MAHDGVFVFREGEPGQRRPALRLEDVLHFDHRKMVVVDGAVGYVGGSGIEDHYMDERFYDVMCRVTGPVVAQLQLVFLASWHNQAGGLPADDLSIAGSRRRPSRSRPTPTGHRHDRSCGTCRGLATVPISDAIEGALAAASERIDIVNPYISNRAILAELLAAAKRGVPVRLIAPGKPTPPYPAAAFRHHYGRLIDAGVEILLHPQMAHAKVLRIDDKVFIGGCNLDDLSLYRNDELDLLLEDPSMPGLAEATVFDELAAMSVPATVPTALRERLLDASMDRVSRLL